MPWIFMLTVFDAFILAMFTYAGIEVVKDDPRQDLKIMVMAVFIFVFLNGWAAYWLIGVIRN